MWLQLQGHPWVCPLQGEIRKERGRRGRGWGGEEIGEDACRWLSADCDHGRLSADCDLSQRLASLHAPKVIPLAPSHAAPTPWRRTAEQWRKHWMGARSGQITSGLWPLQRANCQPRGFLRPLQAWRFCNLRYSNKISFQKKTHLSSEFDSWSISPLLGTALEFTADFLGVRCIKHCKSLIPQNSS